MRLNGVRLFSSLKWAFEKYFVKKENMGESDNEDKKANRDDITEITSSSTSKDIENAARNEETNKGKLRCFEIFKRYFYYEFNLIAFRQ